MEFGVSESNHLGGVNMIATTKRLARVREAYFIEWLTFYWERSRYVAFQYMRDEAARVGIDVFFWD